MTSTERLLDLLAFLLAARRPVNHVEIYEAFSHEYTGTSEARDRKFSRDKEALRAIGIPLVHVDDDDGTDTGGYQIDRAAFFLPDIALTADERAALFAVGAAALRSAFPLRSELAHALTKLRSTHASGEERAQPLLFTGGERSGTFEELIVRAVTDRKKLKLVYPPEAAVRTVDPYAFSARRNRFAFVGYCHLRKGIRTFHADRVTHCLLLTPSASRPEFDVPADFDATPHLPVHPWQVRIHEPVEVQLEFTPELAESGPQFLGVVPGEPCRTTNLDGLIAQVLALGGGVTIVGPEKARARLREKLATLKTALGKTS